MGNTRAARRQANASGNDSGALVGAVRAQDEEGRYGQDLLGVRAHGECGGVEEITKRVGILLTEGGAARRVYVFGPVFGDREYLMQCKRGPDGEAPQVVVRSFDLNRPHGDEVVLDDAEILLSGIRSSIRQLREQGWNHHYIVLVDLETAANLKIPDVALLEAPDNNGRRFRPCLVALKSIDEMAMRMEVPVPPLLEIDMTREQYGEAVMGELMPSV